MIGLIAQKYASALSREENDVDSIDMWIELVTKYGPFLERYSNNSPRGSTTLSDSDVDCPSKVNLCKMFVHDMHFVFEIIYKEFKSTLEEIEEEQKTEPMKDEEKEMYEKIKNVYLGIPNILEYFKKLSIYAEDKDAYDEIEEFKNLSTENLDLHNNMESSLHLFVELVELMNTKMQETNDSMSKLTDSLTEVGDMMKEYCDFSNIQKEFNKKSEEIIIKRAQISKKVKDKLNGRSTDSYNSIKDEAREATQFFIRELTFIKENCIHKLEEIFKNKNWDFNDIHKVAAVEKINKEIKEKYGNDAVLFVKANSDNKDVEKKNTMQMYNYGLRNTLYNIMNTFIKDMEDKWIPTFTQMADIFNSIIVKQTAVN